MRASGKSGRYPLNDEREYIEDIIIKKILEEISLEIGFSEHIKLLDLDAEREIRQLAEVSLPAGRQGLRQSCINIQRGVDATFYEVMRQV